MFEALDFLYTPSADVAADVEHFTGVLGAELVFAIEAFGARVAMLRLSASEPALLFADHLGGERPVLLYRVADLEAAMSALEARGWAGRRAWRSRTARAARSALRAGIESASTSSRAPT